MSKSNPWFLTGDDFPDDFIDDFIEKGAIVPPPFVSNFDLKKFCRQVLGTMSLNLKEKNHIFDSLPTLTAFQCDALEDTFSDETVEFCKLGDEYPIVLQLSAATIIAACALTVHRGAGISDAAEETAMIRQMGLTKRKSSRRIQQFLKRMPWPQPIVAYVYGETPRQQADKNEIPTWLRKEI